MKFLFNPFTGTFSATEDIQPYLSQYLPLTGGTITGTLSCTSNAFVSGGQVIVTNTTSSPSASAVTNIITLTESDYNALTIKDSQTLYIVV